jgi:hypothetical protein
VRLRSVGGEIGILEIGILEYWKIGVWGAENLVRGDFMCMYFIEAVSVCFGIDIVRVLPRRRTFSLFYLVRSGAAGAPLSLLICEVGCADLTRLRVFHVGALFLNTSALIQGYKDSKNSCILTILNYLFP